VPPKLGNHIQALAVCGQALALHQRAGERTGQANTWDSLGHAHHHPDAEELHAKLFSYSPGRSAAR
jgi:hypothetical protein